MADLLTEAQLTAVALIRGAAHLRGNPGGEAGTIVTEYLTRVTAPGGPSEDADYALPLGALCAALSNLAGGMVRVWLAQLLDIDAEDVPAEAIDTRLDSLEFGFMDTGEQAGGSPA